MEYLSTPSCLERYFLSAYGTCSHDSKPPLHQNYYYMHWLVVYCLRLVVVVPSVNDVFGPTITPAGPALCNLIPEANSVTYVFAKLCQENRSRTKLLTTLYVAYSRRSVPRAIRHRETQRYTYTTVIDERWCCIEPWSSTAVPLCLLWTVRGKVQIRNFRLIWPRCSGCRFWCQTNVP